MRGIKITRKLKINQIKVRSSYRNKYSHNRNPFNRFSSNQFKFNGLNTEPVNRDVFRQSNKFQKRTFITETIATIAAVTTAYVTFNYKVARSDEYIAKTGPFIEDIEISKQTLRLPFQKIQGINMRPKNYKFNLDAMSSQKMEFILPGVFSIGPNKDFDALENYSRYLVADQHSENLVDLVRGVIEGETRVLAATMTIEELFSSRDKFKSEIIKNIQGELDQFGLVIFNANIKELQDAEGSEYFQYMRQKTRSEAESKAKIDISEARKNADIGEKQRRVTTRIENSKLESKAIEIENENKKKIAVFDAELGVVEAESKKTIGIANYNSEKEIEKVKAEKTIEALRASDLTEITVQAEMKIAEADAELYKKQREADAIAINFQKNAEGIHELLDSFNGDNQALMQYLMIRDGVYVKLANENAKAIKELKPKITVWNTGSKESGSNPIKDIMTMLPPMLTTIHDQTGLKPGEWLMQGLESNEKKI